MDTLVDFAKNTSIHGIKYVVLQTTSRVERVFWIGILIGSLAFSGYLTTLFWARYTSNPIRTTLKTAFAPATTVPFPAVTICNRQNVLESKVDTFINKLEASENEKILAKNIFSHILINQLATNTKLEYNVSELNVTQNILDQNDYSDVQRIVRRVSQRCEDLILRCAWNKKQVLCKDIFEESFTSDGRCCSFNYIRENFVKSAIYTLYYGLSTGLRVTLRPDYNNKNLGGVTVIIHSPTEYAGAHQNIRKYLALGQINYIQIEGSKRECTQDVKNLPVVHRQCVHSEERKLDYFGNYVDSNCMSLCEAMSYLKHCKCVPYYFDFVDDRPKCTVVDLPCLQRFKNVSTASCDCPSQCEKEFYDVRMTSAKFIYSPDISMMDYMTDINDTERSILFNIFFSTNYQTIWLRDTMTSYIYLLSSFGGIYSLFLGCSIITLIEILYYGIVKLIINTTSQKENSTNNKKRNRTKKVGFENDDIYAVSAEMNRHCKTYASPIIPFVN